MDKQNAIKDDDRFCRDIGIGYTFKCSKCGCTLDLLDTESNEPTIWLDGVAIVPQFCVACGREVEG